MSHIRLKGFKLFKDRYGKQRCYHRKTGIAVDLEKVPLGSSEFFAECSRIVSLSGSDIDVKPGTFGKLVIEYKKHPAYKDLSDKTKADYSYHIERMRPAFDLPLTSFDPPLIINIRDRIATKHGRASGNFLKTVLNIVFAWGRERGYVVTNPASGIKNLKRSKDAPQPNRPWTDTERENVLVALPPHMRVPFHFMIFCGLDPVDVISLPRTAVKDGLIDTRRAKTLQPVWIPLPEPVLVALENAPPHSATTLCVNKFGRPWSRGGLNSSWQDIKKKLLSADKIGDGLTLKGLRHTVATILAEMGYDDRTIADMLGQKTLAMAQHYSRRANRSKKLAPVVENLVIEMNKRGRKIVKL